jgi:hypothetical protein
MEEANRVLGFHLTQNGKICATFLSILLPWKGEPGLCRVLAYEEAHINTVGKELLDKRFPSVNGLPARFLQYSDDYNGGRDPTTSKSLPGTPRLPNSMLDNGKSAW